MSAYADDIIPGDVVSVSGNYGRKEGIVVGSHLDHAGRQILEVQLEHSGEIYQAWYPTVTRVKRTVSYVPNIHRQRTVQRTIYW